MYGGMRMKNFEQLSANNGKKTGLPQADMNGILLNGLKSLKMVFPFHLLNGMRTAVPSSGRNWMPTTSNFMASPASNFVIYLILQT